VDPRTALEEYAISMLGLPYKWGGSNHLTGYDCSGLVIELLKSQGVFKVHDATAQQLADMFPTPSTPTLGALVFFGKSRTSITHVGMALNSTLMIEAGGGDSSVTSKAVAEEAGAWVRIRPISLGRTPVLITIPPYGWVQPALRVG
jgi:cell wall-associated NlpC family hydrolase